MRDHNADPGNARRHTRPGGAAVLAFPRRVHGTVRISLRTGGWGFISLPAPTKELGGLSAIPAGLDVILDIGAAHRIDQATARDIATALRAAGQITVIGTDPEGVNAIRAEIERAVNR